MIDPSDTPATIPPSPSAEPSAYEPPVVECLGNLREIIGKSGDTPDFQPGEYRP